MVSKVLMLLFSVVVRVAVFSTASSCVDNMCINICNNCGGVSLKGECNVIILRSDEVYSISLVMDGNDGVQC